MGPLADLGGLPPCPPLVPWPFPCPCGSPPCFPELSLCSFTIHHYCYLSHILITFLLLRGVSPSLLEPLLGVLCMLSFTPGCFAAPPTPSLLLPHLLLLPFPASHCHLLQWPSSFCLPSSHPLSPHCCFCNLSYNQGLSIQKNK